jgi:hypothetical protein
MLPRLPLILMLMSLVLVIIIGVAYFVFRNFSDMTMSQGLALFAMAMVGLILVGVILFFIMKAAKQTKKP